MLCQYMVRNLSADRNTMKYVLPDFLMFRQKHAPKLCISHSFSPGLGQNHWPLPTVRVAQTYRLLGVYLTTYARFLELVHTLLLFGIWPRRTTHPTTTSLSQF
jgi:hypothetical protein